MPQKPDERPVRLPAGRKAELASFITRAQQVTVSELADYFDVSTDTIRRDLQELHNDGLILRTHGGAVSVGAAAAREKQIDDRLALHTDAKDQIGALAATLVADDSVLMLNAGTTTLSVVRHLRNHRNLTIATNNLRVPSEIPPDVTRDFYMFGGSVRLRAQATIGAVAFQLQNGRDLEPHSDLALVSVGSVSPSVGYSTSNVSEAIMMAEMMERSTRAAILVDSSKFSTPLFARVAELGLANYLVTEKAPPAELADALRQENVQVMIADRLDNIDSDL